MKIDLALLAEKASQIERHLARVADRLPERAEDFKPSTDTSDAVILHLWMAVQAAIDLALSSCVQRKLGAPATYADAFRALAGDGVLDRELADRLTRASGFRNLVAHAYEGIDLVRVHAIACTGPADLRAFLAALRDAR